QVANQPSNPDAQWASYMRFKIPRLEWERTGRHSVQLENQWVAAAERYLSSYPHGQYAYEPRFRLAERLQKRGELAEAAKMYEQVSGNPEYDFTAIFNAAECRYKMVGAAEKARGASGKETKPSESETALRTAAIKGLRETIKREPQAEHTAPGQRR